MSSRGSRSAVADRGWLSKRQRRRMQQVLFMRTAVIAFELTANREPSIWDRQYRLRHKTYDEIVEDCGESQIFQQKFGFTSIEFEKICPLLNVANDGDRFRTPEGDVEDVRVCLLITLRYLTLGRLKESEETFGRSDGSMSRIKTAMVAAVWEQWGHLLDITAAHLYHLTPAKLRELSLAGDGTNTYKGPKGTDGRPIDSLAQDIWGWIDGTLRPIARPSRDQREYYTGHKKLHAIKYQVVSRMDGIAYVYGGVNGRRTDSLVAGASGVIAWLDAHSTDPDGRPLYLFGDKGYPTVGRLIAIRPRPDPRPGDAALLKYMAAQRIAVEWTIGGIKDNWRRYDLKRQQKALLSEIETEYLCGAIFKNLMSCLSGNQSSQYFARETPSIHEYLLPRHPDHPMPVVPEAEDSEPET